jgi:GNAT superfamily N-acetyltransferase
MGGFQYNRPAMSPTPDTSLDLAIDAFAQSNAITSSFTHPSMIERFGPALVNRDAARKNAADYRRERWTARGMAPTELDKLTRRHARGRYCICAIQPPGEPEDALRAGYKSLGYRLQATESFMMHSLAKIPAVAEPFLVERVLTQELADRVTKSARYRQLLPAHLAENSSLRQYAVVDRQTAIAWGKSIAIGDSAWVDNLFVVEKYRRRGIAKAMMACMLRDDRAHGAKRSLLMASHTGAMLYPLLGYKEIGKLFVFVLTRK